jgi:hypothetical protein
MDKYLEAYNLGKRRARADFEKSAGAKDVAELVKLFGSGASEGLGMLGKALSKATGGAQAMGRGAKYLQITADPRAALLGGGIAAAAGTLGPAQKALASGGTLGDAALAAVPGLAATLGAGLAAGANPGLLGGSAANRITHELAMQSATPAGQLAVLSGLVGLPAGLIAYGKSKGREEASLF